MGTDAPLLEVRLLRKAELTLPNKEFYAYVLSCGADTYGRYLRVNQVVGKYIHEHHQSVQQIRDIPTYNYYILGLIRRKDGRVENQEFSLTAEDQNEAFEAVQVILEADGAPVVSETKEITLTKSGPRRMEVVLRKTSNPSLEKRIVVTDYVKPDGYFQEQTLRGRLWTDGETLSRDIDFWTSDQWWISRMDKIVSAVSSQRQHFAANDQEAAWKKLADFYHDLREVERTVLKTWTPTKSPSTRSDNWGSGGFWRGPSYYQKPKAEFRVSGDEIGTTLISKRVASSSPIELSGPDEVLSLREMLEFVEKKEKSDEGEENESSSSAEGTYEDGFDEDWDETVAAAMGGEIFYANNPKRVH